MKDSSLKHTSLADKLQAVEEHFRSGLKTSRTQATHFGFLGTVIEDRWIDLFSYYLPGKYKVGRAFVVDSKGNTSAQIDCVIYDAIHTPALYGENEGLYIPAEAVYAIFEIKQKCRKEQIDAAAKQAKSVRKLYRQYAPITDKGQNRLPRQPYKMVRDLIAERLGVSPKTARKNFSESLLDIVLSFGESADNASLERHSACWPHKIVRGLLTGRLDVKCKTAEKNFSASNLDVVLSVGEIAKDAFYIDRFDDGKPQWKCEPGALMAGLFRFLSKLQKTGTVGAINFSSYERSAMDNADKQAKEISRIRGEFGMDGEEAAAFLLARDSCVSDLNLFDSRDKKSIDIPLTGRHVKRKIDCAAANSNNDIADLPGNESYCLTADKAAALVRAISGEHGGEPSFGREIQPDEFANIVDRVFQRTSKKQKASLSFWRNAADLLCSVVYERPFEDGNKRIAAFLFCWLMDKKDSEVRYRTIGTHGIWSVTLLVADSRPEDKDLLIKLIERLVDESAD